MKHLILFFLFPLSIFASTKVAIIGDSISMGQGVFPKQCYTHLLEERWASEEKDITLLNRSYRGAKTDTGAQIVVNLLTEDRPDYFVLFIGFNDAGANVPQAQLQANFVSMIEKAKPNCKGIVLGGVTGSIFSPAYNSILASAYLYLVNTYHVHPVMLLGKDILDTASDGIHPNALGHEMIAEKLYEALKQVGAYDNFL